MRRFTWLRLVKVSGVVLLATTALFIGVMGFAHTQAGHPLLVMMGMGAKKGLCPFGFDGQASPQQKEAARFHFANLHRGSQHAAARPALGFVLDETTRQDVIAWATSHHIVCSKPRSGADLDCSDIPDNLLPDAHRGADVRSLWFNFGAHDKLITVTAIHRHLNAAVISSTFATVVDGLTKAAGPVATTEGDAAPVALAAGLLRQASAEYRFTDYYALARASNMGDGFVLIEEYRSLPN